MRWAVVRKAFLNLVRWVGGMDLFVLLALLLLIAALWGFVALADEVQEGETHRFDEVLLRSLREPNHPADPIGPRWFEEAMRDVTSLGGLTLIILFTLAVVGYLLLARMGHAAGFVLAAISGGLLLSAVLKGIFERERPSIVPHLIHVQTSSFPSGHSFASVGVYLTLGALLARFSPKRRIKLYFVTVALVFALLVGSSRVYLGVHYPTDVLAGWTAGLMWAILCWLAARYLQRHGQVERGTLEEDKVTR